jgi:hypothetical protein
MKEMFDSIGLKLYEPDYLYYGEHINFNLTSAHEYIYEIE